MLLKTWRFVTIMLVALLMGLAFAHTLERPAKLHYDAELYVTLQQTLYRQWGPPGAGGFLEPAAIVAAVGLAVLVRRREWELWLTLGACVFLLFAFPAVFYAFVAPANEAFATAAPGVAPADWEQQRANWETGHVVRFVLQLGALGLLVGSVLIGGDGSNGRS